MKFKVLVLILPLLFGCQSSVTRKAISQQLDDYPESRVLDIYKSFCQDNLGPGHLIPNPEAARNYLMSELQSYSDDLDSSLYDIPSVRYYPVGDQSNYVSVDLSVLLDGLVETETFLDAFVRSANSGKKATETEWVKKWEEIKSIINKDFPDIPDAGEDLALLDSLIAEGHLIMHHSDAFGEAYHPHYRIIAKDIFENELKGRIDGRE